MTDNLQIYKGRLRFSHVLYNLIDFLQIGASDSNFKESKEVHNTLVLYSSRDMY